MKGEDNMAIYNIPYAASTTSTIGSKSNPIYKGLSINSNYQNTLCKSNYSLLDYGQTCQDFRTLFYSLTGKMPTLTAREAIRLETQFPTTTSKNKIK